MSRNYVKGQVDIVLGNQRVGRGPKRVRSIRCDKGGPSRDERVHAHNGKAILILLQSLIQILVSPSSTLLA